MGCGLLLRKFWEAGLSLDMVRCWWRRRGREGAQVPLLLNLDKLSAVDLEGATLSGRAGGVQARI